MSMDLVAAALAGFDEDSDSNELGEDFAADDGNDPVAMRMPTDVQSMDVPSMQAPSQPPVADGEEAAVSQRRPTDDEATPQKKKRKVVQEPLTSKKQKKKPVKVLADVSKDRMLHCIFEGKVCIPMWPQYDMNFTEKTMYVKVAPKEAWVIQYVGMQRKAWRKGLEPTGLATMQTAKESNSTFCKKILLEFRKVIAEAKGKHKKKFQSAFPGELALKFNGCEIFARSNTRQLHIRADDALLEWIRKGFQKALELHFDDEFKSLRASGQLVLVACGEEKVSHYSGMALGVRDKIYWVPDKRTWALKVKKEKENVHEYLEETNYG